MPATTSPSVKRAAQVTRQTRETNISLSLDLDGNGRCTLHSGIGFFDHMIEQIARHGLIDMTLEAKGDLHIDMHHTVEDCGIVLGQALHQALGDCAGITRYGLAMCPMDEALSRAVIDISGRGLLVWRTKLPSAKIGDMDTELFVEFFRAVAHGAQMTLHIETLYGENSHHIIEGVFKSFARALRQAISLDPRRRDDIPSSKGVL